MSSNSDKRDDIVELKILEVVYIVDKQIYFALAIDNDSKLSIILLTKENAEMYGIDNNVNWDELPDIIKNTIEKTLN